MCLNFDQGKLEVKDFKNSHFNSNFIEDVFDATGL